MFLELGTESCVTLWKPEQYAHGSRRFAGRAGRVNYADGNVSQCGNSFGQQCGHVLFYFATSPASFNNQHTEFSGTYARGGDE